LETDFPTVRLNPTPSAPDAIFFKSSRTTRVTFVYLFMYVFICLCFFVSFIFPYTLYFLLKFQYCRTVSDIGTEGVATILLE
jgi:hypothetical protein